MASFKHGRAKVTHLKRCHTEKSPGIPGFFGVQEAKQRALRLCSNDRHGVTCFGGMPKTLPAASLRFWDLNLRGCQTASQGRRKTKYFLRRAMMKIMALFLFPEKDLGGMQSAKVYRKQDRPCLREFYATDSRLPAGPTRGRDYPERYETEETTERGREK